MEKNNPKKLIVVAVLLCAFVIALILLMVQLFTLMRAVTEVIVPVQAQPQTEQSSQAPTAVQEVDPMRAIVYEIGKFGPDEQRKKYKDGDIILSVPRLEFEGPVLDGTDTEILDKGPGLFEQAQVPGMGNRNVSIAAHRDIRGKEFYAIDKIKEGDYIYITYKGKRYVYLFESSFTTTPEDWEPIRTKDYGCVTLQSCTPINYATHRIFVVGRLVDVVDAGSPISEDE